MARHDVGEVAEGLRGVSIRSDVDVDSASSGGVALGSGVAKLADEFLKGVHVLVGKDRGDHLALFAVGSVDADVLLEFPLAALAVPGAPTAVSVAACGVFVPACAARLRSMLFISTSTPMVCFFISSTCLAVLSLIAVSSVFGVFRRVFSLSVYTYSL